MSRPSLRLLSEAKSSLVRPLSVTRRIQPIASTSFQRCPRQTRQDRRWYSDFDTPQQVKDRTAVGAFTWKSATLFLITGVGLYFYFENEKSKIKEKKLLESATTGVGKANIGGPIDLVTHEGKPFTQEDLKGKFSLIYFGFTNCPDICPEELDKMAEVVDNIDKIISQTKAQSGKPASEGLGLVQPVFVSCDPGRDSVEAMSSYVKDFHPNLIGLTGSFEQVKKACKSYRVYFSTPPDATGDYLVDHSIFFYLMDPNNQFVDAFGKNSSATEVTTKVLEQVEKWRW